MKEKTLVVATAVTRFLFTELILILVLSVTVATPLSDQSGAITNI
jgi:hypothetical protein